MSTRTRVRAKKSEDNFDPNHVAEVGELEQQHAEEPDQEDDVVDASAEDTDEGQEEDDDPSAEQPLGRTRTGMTQGQQAAQAELREYLRRKANLLADKAEIVADIKELEKEFKGKGYDMKALAVLTKLDNMEETAKDKLRDQKAINQTYAAAAGIDEDLV